jgi:group I intron endonuclease
MRQGTVYLITNLINDNKYVGQTVMQLNKRWLAHIQESKTYSERPLYRAINKYGIENFKIKILEECNEDVLSDREIYWIEKLNTYHNGYNATTGGESNNNIREDIKEKISQSMSEIERSDEWVNNVSLALKEKVNRGEKWGFMLCPNEGGKHAKRRVQGINVKTGKIVEFDSITEAAEKVNGKNGNISKAIKEGFTAYGYKWKKLDNRPIAKPVVGYDKKTNELVYEYESISKAEIDIRGKRGTGIINSLKVVGWVAIGITQTPSYNNQQ